MDSQGFEGIKKKLRLTNQGISDTMGVRLRTVQCWADGTFEMPLMAEKFLHTLLSIKRDNEAIYMAGYNKGRLDTTGYDNGYLIGKAEGRREEQKKGRLAQAEEYTTGYDDGHKEGIEIGRASRYSDGYKAGYRAVMETVGDNERKISSNRP